MHVNERHANLSKNKYSYHLLHINCLHFMSKVLKSNKEKKQKKTNLLP